MKIETIRDILAADPYDPEVQLVLGALRDLLNADSPFVTTPQLDGTALKQWRSTHFAEIANVQKRVDDGAWTLFGDREARRRDGLGISLTGYGDSPKLVGSSTRGPTRVVEWIVRFPQAPAEPTIIRYGCVRGAHLAEAMAAVDTRWPMPAWWLSIAAET